MCIKEYGMKMELKKLYSLYPYVPITLYTCNENENLIPVKY